MTLDSLLPPGMTPIDAIALGAGIAAFLSLLVVWNALMVKDPMATRVKALAKRRDQLRAGMLAPQRRSRREPTINFMRHFAKHFRFSHGQSVQKLRNKLARAGFRSRDALTVFLFFKFVSPPLAFGTGFVFLYLLNMYNLPPQQDLLISLGLAIAGFYAPEIYVKNIGDKRMAKLRKGLPDAIDLMVICSEAGLSLDATLDRVAREMANASPELSEELALTTVELRFLPERRKALENLADRVDLGGLQALVNTLLQAEKYGTPLSQSLRVLANEMRNERLMRAEEKAARLPAMLTVPMVIFILPALFVVLIGPGALKTIDGLAGVGF
jgi:tight adherence protein C